MEQTNGVHRRIQQRELWGNTLNTHSTLIARDIIHLDTHATVFNVDYNPDGKLIAACCEDAAIRLFDPLINQSQIATLNAHLDAVNVCTWINEWQFVTGSDDTTCLHWDIRRTDRPVKALLGHQDWVKSIEVLNSQLFTASFDGSILQWNDNECSMVASGLALMRMKVLNNKDIVVSDRFGCIVMIQDACFSSESPCLHLDSLFETFRLLQAERLEDSRFLDIIKSAFQTNDSMDLWTGSNNKNLVRIISEPCNSQTYAASSMCVHESKLLARGFGVDDGIDDQETIELYDIQDSRPPESPIFDSFLDFWSESSIRLGRLTDSCMEPNFIKEPCFSPCGRFVISPYYRGIRLLQVPDSLTSTFSPVPMRSPLINIHDGAVLSACTNPHQALEVCSGGLDHKLVISVGI